MGKNPFFCWNIGCSRDLPGTREAAVCTPLRTNRGPPRDSQAARRNPFSTTRRYGIFLYSACAASAGKFGSLGNFRL
jgi:hypothetical protein